MTFNRKHDSRLFVLMECFTFQVEAQWPTSLGSRTNDFFFGFSFRTRLPFSSVPLLWMCHFRCVSDFGRMDSSVFVLWFPIDQISRSCVIHLIPEKCVSRFCFPNMSGLPDAPIILQTPSGLELLTSARSLKSWCPPGIPWKRACLLRGVCMDDGFTNEQHRWIVESCRWLTNENRLKITIAVHKWTHHPCTFTVTHMGFWCENLFWSVQVQGRLNRKVLGTYTWGAAITEKTVMCFWINFVHSFPYDTNYGKK